MAGGGCTYPEDQTSASAVGPTHLRDHARNEEASVPFVGAEAHGKRNDVAAFGFAFETSMISQRVANSVTFPACWRASHNSIPLGNGEGVAFRDVRPELGTDPSNRYMHDK